MAAFIYFVCVKFRDRKHNGNNNKCRVLLRWSTEYAHIFYSNWKTNWTTFIILVKIYLYFSAISPNLSKWRSKFCSTVFELFYLPIIGIFVSLIALSSFPRRHLCLICFSGSLIINTHDFYQNRHCLPSPQEQLKIQYR